MHFLTYLYKDKGDDIVIADKKVAECYFDMLLGCEQENSLRNEAYLYEVERKIHVQ